MTESPFNQQLHLQTEVEDIISQFGRLTLLPAPKPPSLVVLEQPVDTELNLRSNRRKSNMAFRARRGRGCGRRGRPVANAEVMEAMKQM